MEFWLGITTDFQSEHPIDVKQRALMVIIEHLFGQTRLNPSVNIFEEIHNLFRNDLKYTLKHKHENKKIKTSTKIICTYIHYI